MADSLTVKSPHRRDEKYKPEILNRLAHDTDLRMSRNFDIPIRLNDRWRVVDEQLQWVLQYRAGTISHSDEVKNSKAWSSKHFCRTADTLKRRILKCCGEVDQTALAVVDTLQAQHE